MHIAQGIQKAINVNKLTRAGCTFVFWVADWFAQMNNKMDGDLEKIRTVFLCVLCSQNQVGQYFIEVWKACGMNMERVKFLWASDEINARFAIQTMCSLTFFNFHLRVVSHRE